MTHRPMVSCIMPTCNRRRFVPQAIGYFLRQDYHNREMVIVDDGTDSIQDLVPDDWRIRYIRQASKQSIGVKRNLACQEARGEIIVHWDDDDWHAPHRLSYQVEALLAADRDVCGINTLLFYDLRTNRAWRYVYPKSRRLWLSGSTLCYRRSFWIDHRFENINVGEDARFVRGGAPERMTVLPDDTFHVGIIHDRNVSPKTTNGAYWYPFPIEAMQRLLGTDWLLYHPEHGQTLPRPQPVPLDISERTISMVSIAREADLNLDEYVAFNDRQPLPRMRRWELPFALFQARLSNTMSVLDCTINPAGFREQLTRLYPHVLYRHCSPIQDGQFVLPVGVPDEAFDRAICVNTLEHLLTPQREALVAALARKLKIGGLLILTSDYYFDWFWEDPALQQAGVMRADRKEVLNGWNKVTPQEWLDLCGRHDLHPMADMIEEPREDDPTLYRNQQPYPHACIGGVFFRGTRPNLSAGKKIVLSLLTWNTRDVSLDSARAHVREARMLRRLGQMPVLCFCDNGSTDGTADALRALEPEIDLECRMILNQRNTGNSIARNQIIDYALECDADYVLFMDGDIEVVPFSSFAMLRYMENNGHGLGCIGADSAGQTPNREQASTCLYSIEKVEATNLVAWTQYGMFRRDVFEDGVRFDENEPFDGVGWGFEDNDLAFQMEVKGYLNQRLFGMTYLHRAARSSIRIMRGLGIDARALYTRRQQYVISKWSSIPPINNGPLNFVRRVQIHV